MTAGTASSPDELQPAGRPGTLRSVGIVKNGGELGQD
eukprot:CAMPEP_0174700706 /NCGR_PEP_ID=MMETSP1094-20130205/5575_1 /TAXON_ID=156173 /ORGANISM="Chrysochromulina brevifilum, Strain UTEX LB 985" /LENGTH=36 /DNA_ID= /DNA_START= /DNA_END= /DNA_ORIENTATION=